ncbi:LuxR C-terminal-related transcriptional regulator [Sinomonas sp. JGH33]|uniref:LuxR C-terminal-related transcriptional regulator n=1 Tax=Sinomonas terricola TaxID=3110330 RepID=A0ABU5TAL6_9MICC|nr:LuxR C-terminal-related transcriptional regulator [Sinomonas sp. JGH33]MEA5456685.1 LuxR C-terminal-related transcriptional regulator [Sinomonas sp. JGH33]
MGATLAEKAGIKSVVETTRRDIAAAATEALRREGAGAVLVVGKGGSGKTHVLDAVVRSLGNDVEVLEISTGRSLRSVMYAALIECLPKLAPEEVQDRIGVLRALWAELHRRSGEAERPVVLVVDDAQDLDDGSAGLIAEAVASSWVRLLAAATTRGGLPRDFLDMWHDGMAERVELAPLSLAESQAAAQEHLGGTLSVTAAGVLHRLSGGNPLHLLSLIDESVAAGTLVRRRGIWLLTGAFASSGNALAEPVRSSMEALDPAERDLLILVALTEPLPRSAARVLADREILDRLTDLGWFIEGPDGIRIRHALEADAVRRMTTATRRLHLYRRALALGGDELRQPANELRLLELALDTGASLPAAELVRGAAAAVRSFRNELGLRAASLVDRAAERSLARGVVARAHLNLGDPPAALAVLSSGPAVPSDVQDVLVGTLVKFTARLALGELEQVEGDVADLEKAADGVDRRTGSGGVPFGPGAREAVLRRARLIRALAAAERGDFAAVGSALDHDGKLPQAIAAPAIERGLWLVLDSAVQWAAGHFEASARAAGLALSDSDLDDEHFPFEERALVRYLVAALFSGDWAGVDGAVAAYPDTHLRSIVVFGPSLYCARAIALVRQGREAEAESILRDVVENLELADPLQLLGLASAVAARAAAAAGNATAARQYLARAEATAGLGSADLRGLAAMHRVGALELLEPGTGLARLEAIAEENRAAGRPGWELVARILGFELGATDTDGRGAELAAAAEGPWARAWGAWARAEAREDAEGYLTAGGLFHDLGMYRRARAAYARAAGCFDADGDRAAARHAGALARTCEGLPGSGDAGEKEEAILSSLRLSPREQDVVDLAVDGLSDRQIADQLHLSVRTVEGHLHRSYAKLGIRSRDELRDAVSE